jgi:uncharacterized protein (TIGR03435 family)
MLERIARLLIASIAITAPAQQTPAPAPTRPPTFDVISVKPNHSDFHGITLNYTPDGLRATNIPIFFLIKEAFALNDDQLIGIPGWVHSEKYDIDAKVAEADVPSIHNLTHDQRRQMILQILADRFKLTYHRETRTLPEYSLVIAKSGSKLHEFQPGNDASGSPKHAGQMKMQSGIITASGIPIEPLTRLLSDRVGRPVLDKTGLTGNYDFTLQWADEGHDGPPRGPDPAIPVASAPEISGPSIFTAVEEQLGLKLESEKGPVQVVTIDHIEMPTAN